MDVFSIKVIIENQKKQDKDQSLQSSFPTPEGTSFWQLRKDLINNPAPPPLRKKCVS